MSGTAGARVLRAAIPAVALFAVLVLASGIADHAGAPEQVRALLPFGCVAVVTTVAMRRRADLDGVVERIAGVRAVTPYSALADAAQRMRAGTVEQVLPGLAQVLADGTGARRAVIWVDDGQRLVAAAAHPPADGPDARGPDPVQNLALLMARRDTGFVVTVLDGPRLRAVLAVHKPDAPFTVADQTLIADVAGGAGLLLRGVAMNAELTERVQRADALADELQSSRERLAQAREVERRRLLGELSRATAGQFADLRAHVGQARQHLVEAEPRAAEQSLEDAGEALDRLLGRFRVIARGVYPTVLRGQGPATALSELAADLGRPVALTDNLGARLPWEIESGIYYLVAAVLNALASQPSDHEVRVEIGRTADLVTIRILDSAPPLPVEHLRELLADDTERFAALAGEFDWHHPGSSGALHLEARLPTRMDRIMDDDAPAAPAEAPVP